MKTWTVTAFGRQILKIEMQEEASVADVVRHLVAQRMEEREVDDEYGDLVEGMIPCECCGEMFDPDDEMDDEVNARFADMTERLIWGKPADDDDDDDG